MKEWGGGGGRDFGKGKWGRGGGGGGEVMSRRELLGVSAALTRTIQQVRPPGGDTMWTKT